MYTIADVRLGQHLEILHYYTLIHCAMHPDLSALQKKLTGIPSPGCIAVQYPIVHIFSSLHHTVNSIDAYTPHVLTRAINIR